MFGYFIPIVILILAYNESKDTGLTYSAKIHFWLGWFFAVSFTFMCIIFQVAFLPGIRVWYDLSQVEEVETTDYVEEETEEEESSSLPDFPTGGDDDDDG